jgi:hypothetical protein
LPLADTPSEPRRQACFTLHHRGLM